MKVLISYSGGLDSTTLAFYAKSLGYEVTLATFDDGKHNSFEEKYKYGEAVYDSFLPNLAVAEDYESHIIQDFFCNHYKFKKVRFRFPHLNLLRAVSAKPGNEEAQFAERMGSTFYVGYKMLMATMLVSHASAHGFDEVWFGQTIFDTQYADGLPANYDKLTDLMTTMYGSRVNIPPIKNPLYDYDKVKMTQLAFELKVPYIYTQSCVNYLTDYKFYRMHDHGEIMMLHEPGNTDFFVRNLVHCGRCRSCLERKRAFIELEVEDMTRYAE